MKIIVDKESLINVFTVALYAIVGGDYTDVKESIIELLEKVSATPLPKGHGRLIDADKTLATAWKNFYAHEDEWQKKDPDYVPIGRFYDQNGFECCQQTIVNATTIIEADKENEQE